MSELSVMWKSTMPSTSIQKLRTIRVDDPVHEGHLRDFHRWWQTIETPHRMSQSVKEIAVDGHEKIATKCYHEAPARGGRPRKDGHVKLFYNGWFMATHPGTGVILGLFEMKDPENSDVALNLVQNLLPHYPKVDAVLYDRACSIFKKAKNTQDLKPVKFWCVDKFHAKGHCNKCKCSPSVVPAIDKRLKRVNTSISEQVFSWFRGYSSTFNSMNAKHQRFYVLAYSRRHNHLQKLDDMQHLNPWSARKSTLKRAGVLQKPASRKYKCRVKKQAVLKRPAQKWFDDVD